jgi:hypothetical protein
MRRSTIIWANKIVMWSTCVQPKSRKIKSITVKSLKISKKRSKCKEKIDLSFPDFQTGLCSCRSLRFERVKNKLLEQLHLWRPKKKDRKRNDRKKLH